jgi:hypothetical protein
MSRLSFAISLLTIIAVSIIAIEIVIFTFVAGNGIGFGKGGHRKDIQQMIKSFKTPNANAKMTVCVCCTGVQMMMLSRFIGFLHFV